MNDLSSRLREFFAPRTLLKVAPLWALSGGASIVLGAALRDPQWAQAGLGALLTSIGVNVASSMAYDLVKPDLDDDSREALIAKALEQRDSGVIRLVAEALVAAGPELARALPDATRDRLVALLGRGMHESGGALATIAPSYTVGLSNPQTHWNALQAELRQTIHDASQTVEALEGGVASGIAQHSEHSGGPAPQVVRAVGKGSRAENITQTAIGHSRQAPRPGAAPASERAHLERLLNNRTRRLQQLEARAALEGIHTAPAVTVEIEDLRAEIARIHEQLGE